MIGIIFKTKKNKYIVGGNAKTFLWVLQKHFWDNVLDAGIKQIDKCAGEEFITEFGESPFSHQVSCHQSW